MQKGLFPLPAPGKAGCTNQGGTPEKLALATEASFVLSTKFFFVGVAFLQKSG